MGYSKATDKLIRRMVVVATRQECVFDEPEIERLVAESYKLFNLKVPKIEWCVDITDLKLLDAARAAGAAWAAGAARAAWAAGAAGAVGAVGAAIDYDQYYHVHLHEWLQDPKNKRNENDLKTLQAYELFLKLKEAGGGYWAEQDGVVYVAPNPVIRLSDLRYHSEDKPAIEWMGGLKLHYLHGVAFAKESWEKVVSGKMDFKGILDIKNTEQRLQAMRYNPHALMKENPKLIHKTTRDNELYVIENSEINKIYDEPKVWLLRFRDPSKVVPNNWMVEEADPKVCGIHPDADFVQAYHLGLSHEEYQLLKNET